MLHAPTYTAVHRPPQGEIADISRAESEVSGKLRAAYETDLQVGRRKHTCFFVPWSVYSCQC